MFFFVDIFWSRPLVKSVKSEVLYVDPHPSQFHFLGRLGMCLQPCAVDDPKFMGVAEHEKPGASAFDGYPINCHQTLLAGKAMEIQQLNRGCINHRSEWVFFTTNAMAKLCDWKPHHTVRMRIPRVWLKIEECGTVNLP